MMLAQATMATNHIRTVRGRACPCCGPVTRKERRAQRRRENAAWRKDSDNN